MIKTIKDTKGRKVIGLEIAGKRFSLSKEICHAIYMEEAKANSRNKEIEDRATQAQKTIVGRKYQGTSKDFTLTVQFDDIGRIQSDKTEVEFTKEINDELKSEVISTLESFILASNRAIYKRSIDLASAMKGIQKCLSGKDAA